MNAWAKRWLQLSLILTLLAGSFIPAAARPVQPAVQAEPSGLMMPEGKLPAHAAEDALEVIQQEPTIEINPTQGYAGQAVSVNGIGVRGYSQVRIAWWIGEATETARLANVDTDLQYQATLNVPTEAQAGQAQICAAVANGEAGSEMAKFACLPFTITEPPPASLSGSVPLTASGQNEAQAGTSPQAFSAEMLLVDRNGQLAARAPVTQAGTFSFSGVTPGSYSVGPAGDLPVLADSKDITLEPGTHSAINLEPVTWLACMYAPYAAVTDLLVSPGFNSGLSKPGTPKTIGTYLSTGVLGPTVTVSLQAVLQVTSGKSVQRVEFWLERPDGYTVKIAQDSTAPYQATYNANLLSVGKTKITAKVIMTNPAECTKPKEVYLLAIDHPFKSPHLRNTVLNWNLNLKRYEFSADIPNVPGELPAVFPDPPPDIPLIGELRNKFDMWAHFEGYLELNRQITLHLVQNKTYAEVFSIPILNQTDTWWGSEHHMGSVIDPKTPKVSFAPYDVVSIKKTFTVYKGPLWSFAGIVTVNASVKVGFWGDVTLMGTLEPWTPYLYLRMTPSVGPYIELSMWLDLLLLIGKVGITGHTTVGFGLPLVVKTGEDDQVYFDGTCVSLRIWLEGWAEIYYFFGTEHWDLFDFDIVNKSWGSCGGMEFLKNGASPGGTNQLSELRSLPAPAIASDNWGRMAMAYVEDTTPSEASTTPRIIVRLWDSDQIGWGAPTPVSEAGYFVKDPVIAFVGPNGEALAVWSQNRLSREEGAALGQDVSAIFANQEIYSAYWDGGTWSAPQALTDDVVGDGAAAIAGDESGGATLAWVADTDGDLSTQLDTQIVTREWSGDWGATQYLAPADDAALDAQPAVVRPATRTVTSIIAWTRDLDADLTTNADRSLSVARLSGGVWTEETPDGLPPGTDSPALAWDPINEILYLTFLARGKDGDGVTDTGMGNMGVVWTGRWDATNGWGGMAPLQENGQEVRGEEPTLAVAPNQDVSLLFRRFDEPGTPGGAGALAFSQYSQEMANFSQPLYLKPQLSVNWMQAATTYAASQLVVVSLNRPVVETPPLYDTRVNSPAPRVRSLVMPVAGTAETLETSVIEYAPDPALDPELGINPRHATPGSPVNVSATLRNLGRQAATGMTVSLYAGEPGSGDLIDSQDVVGPLEFNDSQEITFEVVASGEAQPLYATVTPGGPDLDIGNNTATGDAGELPPPGMINAQADPEKEGSVLVSWMPPAVGGIAGYRILRATKTGGPYELVGLSLGNFFTDTGLERGRDYFFVVQSYDAGGQWSVHSLEAGINIPKAMIYIPQVSRE